LEVKVLRSTHNSTLSLGVGDQTPRRSRQIYRLGDQPETPGPGESGTRVRVVGRDQTAKTPTSPVPGESESPGQSRPPIWTRPGPAPAERSERAHDHPHPSQQLRQALRLAEPAGKSQAELKLERGTHWHRPQNR
jgi:hypothetical protein